MLLAIEQTKKKHSLSNQREMVGTKKHLSYKTTGSKEIFKIFRKIDKLLMEVFCLFVVNLLWWHVFLKTRLVVLRQKVVSF